MKNSRLTVGLLLLICPLLFTNCTRDAAETYQSTTKEFISEGKWAVDYYFAGSDKTNQFSSYEFTFMGNGNLSGAAGGVNFTGTWTMLRDVNRNDVIRMNIETGDPHLSELSEQWNVTEKNSRVISMKEEASQLRLRKL